MTPLLLLLLTAPVEPQFTPAPDDSETALFEEFHKICVAADGDRARGFTPRADRGPNPRGDADQAYERRLGPLVARLVVSRDQEDGLATLTCQLITNRAEPASVEAALAWTAAVPAPPPAASDAPIASGAQEPTHIRRFRLTAQGPAPLADDADLDRALNENRFATLRARTWDGAYTSLSLTRQRLLQP